MSENKSKTGELGLQTPGAIVPAQAIEASDEARNPSPSKKSDAPATDEYSSERISPDEPADADVKSGRIDDNVMPG